jgi:hypothetical protein
MYGYANPQNFTIEKPEYHEKNYLPFDADVLASPVFLRTAGRHIFDWKNIGEEIENRKLS